MLSEQIKPHQLAGTGENGRTHEYGIAHGHASVDAKAPNNAPNGPAVITTGIPSLAPFRNRRVGVILSSGNLFPVIPCL